MNLNFPHAAKLEGACLLLHSSISRTLKLHQCTPEEIILTFLDYLGINGTLILPLFNFSFTRGELFDIRSSPSKMGTLTEIARQWPGAVRTGHPVYSFAVIGAHADKFSNIKNYSAYGADSPFSKLREMDGQIAVLDLPDQKSMTFYHHVEEMLNVPYRYHKEFIVDYTDASGHVDEHKFSIFVRNIEKGVATSVNRMGERLWDRGHYFGERPGQGSGLRVIRARALFDDVAAVINAGRAKDFLYEIEK